jgi:hypothetical protein
MAYYDVALLTADVDFTSRVTACYASEPSAGSTFPSQWVQEHIWSIAASPGFGDAYAYALATNLPNPGRDPAVISDNQILAAVQAHMQT